MKKSVAVETAPLKRLTATQLHWLLQGQTKVLTQSYDAVGRKRGTKAELRDYVALVDAIVDELILRDRIASLHPIN